MGDWRDDKIEQPPSVEPLGRGEYVISGGAGARTAPVIPSTADIEPKVDLARSAANAATFGMYDRAEGVARALAGNAPNYSSGVDEAVARTLAGRERDPVGTTMADLGAGVLGGAGMARAGLTLAGLGGGRILPQLSYAGLEGLMYGGAQGAGNVYTGNPLDYAAGAGQGGVMGGLLGLGAPVLGRAGSALAGVPRDPRFGQIPPALAEAANTDRLGLLNLQANFGDRAMLTEGGPSMLGTAQGAVPGGAGPGRAALINALRARNEEANAEIARNLNRLFGPEPVPSYGQAGVQRDIDALSPHYDAAYANARAIDTNPLALWLEGRIGNTRGPAQTALQQVRGMLDIPTNPGVLDPHPRALGAARTAVRGMRDSANDPAVRAALGQVYDQMTTELRAKVPGIDVLDSYRAELGSRMDALGPGSAGSRIFETGREGVIRPDEMRDVLEAAATPKGVLNIPSQEPMFLRDAARAELGRIVGTNRNDLAKLNQVLAEPQDYNHQKLAIMFGQDRADQVARVLRGELQFRDTYNKIVENSQTAQRSAAVKAQEAGMGADLKTMTVPGAAMASLNWLKNQMMEGAARRARDRVAEVLATRDPQVVRDLIPALLRAQPARQQRSQNIRDLIQGGYIGGEAGVISK